jgi:hypothetical protein
LFVEGDTKRSPSCQACITPQGEVEVLSTHEQILGGPNGQEFLGCAFPADGPYSQALIEATHKVGLALARHGAMGRFAVDFMAVAQADGTWTISAIEINLRPGGTTHTTNVLKLLCGGEFDANTNSFKSPRTGAAKAYLATDNFVDPGLAHATPKELIAALDQAGLSFDKDTERGVVAHMLGGIPKLGFTAIANSPDDAAALFDATEATLHALAARQR